MIKTIKNFLLKNGIFLTAIALVALGLFLPDKLFMYIGIIGLVIDGVTNRLDLPKKK